MRPPSAIVVGTGRMATALCAWLAAGAHPQITVVGRRLAAARGLQRRYGFAHAWRWDEFLAQLGAAAPRSQPPSWILLAVPDDALPAVAEAMAQAKANWRGWCVLHTSGARPAAVLRGLRRRGAAVASMHPMMTFPRGTATRVPIASAGVVFSLEGDAAARRCAAALVRQWRGQPLVLTPAAKTAYHLAATLVGPGAVVQMAAAVAVLRRAGLRGGELARAQAGLVSLLEATARNLHYGTESAWTGPLARGDAETVAAHWRTLRSPALRRLYAALVDTGLDQLPSPNPVQLRRRVRLEG